MSAPRADSHADALEFYEKLRAATRVPGRDFFEGVVMKRAVRASALRRKYSTTSCGVMPFVSS